MIPAAPRESFRGYPPRYQYHYRQVWIPATVLVCPPRQSPSLLSPSPRKWVPHTSADELCAASVLLNLSPKEEPVSKKPSAPPSYRPDRLSHWTPRAPTTSSYPPETIAVPSHYAKRWENYYQPRLTSIPEKHTSLPIEVSDHSVSGHSAISEGGSTEDEGYMTDEAPMEKCQALSAPKVEAEDTGRWMHGSTSLALPEDIDVLSPLHCFMRRYCVEAFSASPDDVSTPRYGKSHGVKVVVGQVGIRCLYCKHRAVGQRPERAVCYPSSLKNIYHSIETWQRRHCLVCTDIPPWVRKSILELMESSKSRAGGRRQYWEDSASRLGMIDTPHGVRFSRTPGDLGAPDVSTRGHSDASKSEPVVFEEDRELVTEYLFLLMDQMQTCKFTEEDRTGGRSKIKDNEIGFPGMQCKHCQGKAGFGRYFPVSINALALANSDRNIYNHLQKCRRCPSTVKTNLLKLSQDQTPTKNRRGLRKMFFQRVWNRIHKIDT